MGDNINLWVDKCLSDFNVNLHNIPYHLHSLLKAKVTYFISGNSSSLLASMEVWFPYMALEIQSTIIHVHPCNDKLVWRSSTSSVLDSKLAYLTINPPRNLLGG